MKPSDFDISSTAVIFQTNFITMSQFVLRILSTTRNQLIQRSKNVEISKFSRYMSSYEGDGKTKISILNKEHDAGLMIDSFSQYGFRLNNEMVVMGPMAIFPKSVLSWNVNTFLDINEDSLSLFYTLDPKIDVLVIGIGDEKVTPAFSRELMKFMKAYKINVEILRTEQACATFNFLNSESRMVAAALIPPLHISSNENDMLQSKLKQKSLYKTTD